MTIQKHQKIKDDTRYYAFSGMQLNGGPIVVVTVDIETIECYIKPLDTETVVAPKQ